MSLVLIIINDDKNVQVIIFNVNILDRSYIT